MIVLKYNDTVYIAQSCWKISDPEERKTGNVNPENMYMWHPQEQENRLIALSRSGRLADIFRYEDIFPSEFDRKHIVFESHEKMVQLSDRFGFLDDKHITARVVFAQDDNAYIVYPGGAHIELENIFLFTADDAAIMALYDLKGIEEPYKFFKDAFTTLEYLTKYTMFPVIVMNTKNNKLEVINR